MSAATIIDEYIAAREALRELIGSHDNPFTIDDCRGLRWFIATLERNNGETRKALYVERGCVWIRQFCWHSHEVTDVGDDVSWVRETNPQHDILYVLTTSLRCDAAADAFRTHARL